MKLKTRLLIIVMVVIFGLVAISGLSGYLLLTVSHLKNAEMVCHDAVHTLTHLKRLNSELLFSETLDDSFADWRAYYGALQTCMNRLGTSPDIASLLKTEKQQASIKAMNNFWEITQNQLDRLDRGISVLLQEKNASRDGLIYQYMNSGDYHILTLKNSVDEAALYLSSEFESKLTKLTGMVESAIDNRMNRTIRYIILVNLLIAVSVSGILIAFFTKINRNFMLWRNAMEKIGIGGFPAKLAAPGHDEFSQMSRAINRTSDNLRAIHKELERRIEELSGAKEALRESEAERRQIMKAESLMRMAGAISHKFNNHLQAVMGNLEMAIADVSRTGEVPKPLAAAMASACRAAELSGRMHIYTGKAAGRLEFIDLSDYCRTSLPLFEASVPEKISLKTDFTASDLIIKANAAQIQQIITFLITNACESMNNDHGEIEVTVKTAHPSDFPDAHRFPLAWEPMETVYACLELSDGGCGIASDDIENIFDPFFSTNVTGRGLGLPVVLGIAVGHNGGVSVESRAGKGSVFRVFFPLDPS